MYLIRPADHISCVDKGVFVMLYLSSCIETNLTFDDIHKNIPSCSEDLPSIPVSSIIMVGYKLLPV